MIRFAGETFKVYTSESKRIKIMIVFVVGEKKSPCLYRVHYVRTKPNIYYIFIVSPTLLKDKRVVFILFAPYIISKQSIRFVPRINH